MAKYLIHANIQKASGTQTWSVTADSPEDALRKHKAGESAFYGEQVEVTSLSEPTIEDICEER
jgi:hypothetical protein